jgi:hypothetical protein
MNEYEILISVFVEKLEAGVLTMKDVEDIYQTAPPSVKEGVLSSIKTRIELYRLVQLRNAS